MVLTDFVAKKGVFEKFLLATITWGPINLIFKRQIDATISHKTRVFLLLRGGMHSNINYGDTFSDRSMEKWTLIMFFTLCIMSTLSISGTNPPVPLCICSCLNPQTQHRCQNRQRFRWRRKFVNERSRSRLAAAMLMSRRPGPV